MPRGWEREPRCPRTMRYARGTRVRCAARGMDPPMDAGSAPAAGRLEEKNPGVEYQ